MHQSPDQLQQLQAQVHGLQTENHALRQELERLQRNAQVASDARKAVLIGGGRLLVPMLDRHKVVRSFGKLAGTASEFAAPMDQWPSRDQVLADTREFLESCVRFMVRRRAIITLFSLLATTIPLIQIYLVMQQNEIIENQVRLSEMQVFEVVSRSMVDGNRNARLMTSALLSRSDLGFVGGVIDEAFSPDLGRIHGREGLDASARRLEDAAFRGHLIRALAHGVQTRGQTEDAAALFERTDPMFRRVLTDAADRVPVVLRLGESADGLDGDLKEQVDHYLAEVGDALRTHARLARAAGQEQAAVQVAGKFLARASAALHEPSAFADAFVGALDHYVIDVGLERDFGASDETWNGSDPSVEDARAKGIERLRGMVSSDEVNWTRLETTLGSS